MLSQGDVCELTRIDGNYDDYGEEGPPCVLTFRAGGVSQQHEYKCMFGKGTGSVRLQRPPPTLSPLPRAFNKNLVSADTRSLVKQHAHDVCPESPCKRDVMAKHVGPRVWEKRQALILTCTRESLYTQFNDKHPNLLSSSKYDEVLSEEVWQLKRAYRQTCLCRTCFNCRLYREGLAVVSQLLALLLKNPVVRDEDDEAAEHADEAPEDPPNPDLVKLHAFCASHQTGRRLATSDLVCSDTLENATARCLQGKCSNCGFRALWMPVRKTLVYDAPPAGKLRTGVSRVWITGMSWDRIKTGGDGSHSEDELRQHREGTVIELLDEACTAYSNFTSHSFHIDQAKVADRECEHVHTHIHLVRHH